MSSPDTQLVVRLNARIHQQREELAHKEFVIGDLRKQLTARTPFPDTKAVDGTGLVRQLELLASGHLRDPAAPIVTKARDRIIALTELVGKMREAGLPLLDLEAPAEHLPEPMSSNLLAIIDNFAAALKLSDEVLKPTTDYDPTWYEEGKQP
jgi:hypothetical protein